ncbi:MAG: hypothetical protein RLZZ350_1049 [Verrucomicrobiota bacterium]|jgi:sec-independent protein translocase protein TatC
MLDPRDAAPGDAAAEDGGGPVKTFLDHLEDLRWVVVKSMVTLGLAFVVCLVAGNWVVAVLTYPLKKATVKYPPDHQVVTFLFGQNRLGVMQLPPAEKKVLGLGTNQFVTLHLQPITVGTNQVLGFTADHNFEEANKLAVPLVSQSPAGSFITAVQVAIYAGGIISAPFIMYFVAAFVFPALKWKERKYIYQGMMIGLGLFFSGVAFCYFLLLPVSLSASVSYTEWLGFSVQQWRSEDYISFVCRFMLGMGLGFEMPVVLLVLVKIGILNYRILSKARRYVIVLNFFLGAVLTTPEIITQVLMALPLQVLYEISVWIAWYWERQERKRNPQTDAD